MGSVQHHQAQARRFLALARSDHNAGEYARAANALARAASHAATAAAIHETPLKRLTRRKLTNCLFALAWQGRISNGHVNTFRNIYRLPDLLAAADTEDASRISRRARNRVAALIRSLEAAIAGQPANGRAGRPPVPPSLPAPMSARDIIAHPKYRQIAEKYGLVDAPLARRPDPHGFYTRGRTPPPCPCHPRKLSVRDTGSTIELSPLWQRALKRAFHVKYPDTIPAHQ